MGRNTFIIAVHCSKCKTFLYRYKKEGGGSLIKCYADMILSDNTKGDLRCSSCGQRESFLFFTPELQEDRATPPKPLLLPKVTGS